MIEFSDRDQKTDRIRMALNMVDIMVDYQCADLMQRTLREVEKRGDHFSLDDAVHIRCEWERDWKEYHERKKNTEEEQP